MSAPLYDKLKEYSKRDFYSFHMPGHKGFFIEEENPFALDITEIEGFDNLHQPTGVIKQAQELAAKTFGAKETIFLVNGSSSGIIASIMATAFNKPIIVGRNCHKSVFDGFIVSGAVPSYIMPEVVSGFPVFGGVLPETVEKACAENKGAGAVIIVSPTFEGIVSDVEKIANIVHKHNMVLIVDEAHGAHFNFSPYFPESAVKRGADIVIQSIHKTLPCPTQSSLLHICGDRVDVSRLKKCLTITQTTSPSYLFMAMIDKCRQYLDTDGVEAFNEYTKNLESLRTSLEELKNFRILNEKVGDSKKAWALDKGKIVVFSNTVNCLKIGDILREEGKIQLEMCCPTHFIAMTSVADKKEGFERLKEILFKVDKMEFVENGTNPSFLYPVPQVKVAPREAFGAGKAPMAIETSLGEIAADFVIPYPPGIPLISPGELITGEIIEALLKYKKCNVNVIGMEHSGIEKIMVLK